MNDAGNNHSTRLQLLRSLLPDDGDTPAQAIRRYGRPDWVAEMERLVELETARLFPRRCRPGRQARRNGTGKWSS